MKDTDTQMWKQTLAAMRYLADRFPYKYQLQFEKGAYYLLEKGYGDPYGSEWRTVERVKLR